MFIKKKLFYLCIILLFVSIYSDVRKDVQLYNDNYTDLNLNLSEQLIYVKKRTKPGDTILSLVEEVNDSITNEINIERIINDFKTLNPSIQRLELRVHEYYNVPVYKNEKRAD